MGQSRGTVDEGFTLQLAPFSSYSAANKHSDIQKMDAGTVSVCVCVCSGLLVWQLPWHQVGSSHST